MTDLSQHGFVGDPAQTTAEKRALLEAAAEHLATFLKTVKATPVGP